MTAVRFMFLPALALWAGVFGAVAVSTGAQGIGAPDRRQAYLDLTTSLRLLCVAPFPGDEDGAALAFYRKGRGVRTAVAFVTCGESGNSAVGPEWGDALRVVRMNECEAATHALGARAYYLHLPDPGPARSAKTVLARWGEEKIRERLVRVIRQVRPHVVLFSSAVPRVACGTREAVFRMVQRAIVEAADLSCFDDHLQELLYPWRVRRMFESCGANQATVTLDLGQRDPPPGATTYAELGEQALARHRSQGLAARPGSSRPNVAGYRQVLPPPTEAPADPSTSGDSRAQGSQGDPPEPNPPEPESPDTSQDSQKKPLPDDLFQGLVGFDQIELELKKTADFEHAFQVEQQIVKAGRELLELGPDDPRARTLVVEALAALNRLNEKPLASRDLAFGEYIQEKGYQHFLRQRANELSQAMRQVLRIGVRVRLDRKPVAPDQRFPLDVKVATDAQVTINKLVVLLEPSPSFAKTYVEQRNRVLTRDAPAFAYFKIRVAEQAPVTLPAVDYYRTLWTFPPGLRFAIDGRFQDQHFAFHVTAAAPAVVAPVQLQPGPDRVWRRLADATRDGIPVVVDFRTQGPLFLLGGRPPDKNTPLRFKLWAEAPPSIQVEPASVVVENLQSGHPSNHRFLLKIDAAASGAAVTFHARLIQANQPETLAGPDYTAVVPVDVMGTDVAPRVRVGVIAGHDQTLVDALRSLGVDAQVLDGKLEEALLLSDPARRIDVLMVGQDAVAVRTELRGLAEQVKTFVAQGGTVVFFCQPPDVWNPDRDRASLVSPPFSLGRVRLVDEGATVTLLAPEHPLLSRPNRLDSRTFEGWVGERGRALPSSPAGSWLRLLSVASGRDQKPLDTALLVAEHGKGAFVYTALSVRSQLEAAVPGAFSLLANLAGYVRAK